MTFIGAETASLGSPVELYQFAYQDANIFRYTSADEDYEEGPVTFEAVPIKRSRIEYGQDLGRLTLNLEVPLNFAVLELFKSGTPSGVLTLSVFRLHRGDGEKALVWSGRIVDVSWSGATATMSGEPIQTSLKNYGLRRNFQRSCPHVLYECGVSSVSFQTSGTVSAITGNVITATAWSALADNYFAGGYVEYESSITGLPERRAVVANSGGNLTLLGTPVGLSVGATVAAFAGCDKSTTTCQNKFGNIVNYGGFPHTPTKNPFGSDPIY